MISWKPVRLDVAKRYVLQSGQTCVVWLRQNIATAEIWQFFCFIGLGCQKPCLAVCIYNNRNRAFDTLIFIGKNVY